LTRRRGVDVRLVLPGFSDFWAPLYAGRSHYADLLGAGVRIFERRDAASHGLTRGEWARRGPIERAREWFARPLEYLL
jgi:phosphatidylserine/phosphatidylglycerophosphate/cardiolipin synthase-like enzyme